MDYLIRLAQTHESFRRAELEALAVQENVEIEIVDYQPESPFCVLRFHPSAGSKASTADIARSFISRSILSRGIYELWGQGTSYELLHEDVRNRSSAWWPQYLQASFRFSIDSFCGKRSSTEQREIINTFRYMAFQGKISMKSPDVEFVVFEEWPGVRDLGLYTLKTEEFEVKGLTEERKPRRLFFGHYIGGTRRQLSEKHDLKKRPYISTTSMDAELALVTATLALAAPGKMFLDPFVGTGGFMVAASELGALSFGSDIDGRSFRGKGHGLVKGVGANFKKYNLGSLFGDCFIGDLTNTPLRYQMAEGGKMGRWLDGIISDPPYGVREGLKVLGTRQNRSPANAVSAEGEIADADSDVLVPVKQPYLIDGVLAHTLPGYIAPKKPYSFTRMLDDILDFAARTLVDGGRLAFWMPSANEIEQEFALPKHPYLELKHVCVQSFNKWSRRLLVYERMEGDMIEGPASKLNGVLTKGLSQGLSADELNPFRKMYFKGFQTEQT